MRKCLQRFMRKRISLHLIVVFFFLVSTISVATNVQSAVVRTSSNAIQPITVKGHVQASLDNLPLTGVVVLEVGTQNGVVTDLDGNYSITVKNENSVLEFSMIGYLTESLTVGNQSVLDVTMAEDIKSLNEVVLVGYGVQKKSSVTGAIAQLGNKDFENTAVPHIESALQGKAAGVYVMNSSGKAGAGADVMIRGAGTLGGGYGPLWIIDGVQSSSDKLNMNDVDKLEIIKDGTAAAIYGAKAANGVIMVTTKRGSGKSKISFNSYLGTSSPWRLPKMVNSDELIQLKNEYYTNANLAVPDGYSLDSLGKYKTTDWFKAMFKPSRTQNYDLSFSGSNEKSNYYISANYYDVQGTFVDNSYTRYGLRLNSDHQINKWLKFGESANLTYAKTNPVDDEARYLDGIVRSLPMMPVYNPKNQPGGFGYVDYVKFGGYDGGNPMADQLSNKRLEDNYGANGNAYLTATLLKGLSVTGTMSGSYGGDYYKTKFLPYYYADKKSRTDAQMDEGYSMGWDLLSNVYTNYVRDFGKHSFNAMAGWETKQGASHNMDAHANNLNYNLWVLNQAPGDKRTVSGGEGVGERVQSFFGRLQYTYDNKYTLQGLVRRDASGDKFGPDNRYGVFPSVAASWLASNEEFLKNSNLLSYLKVRGGYGVNGSSEIDQFLFQAQYTSGANYPYGSGTDQHAYQGIYTKRLANPAIKWQEVHQVDMGIDLGFFQNKLLFTIEPWQKKTFGLLYTSSLPLSSGLGAYQNDPTYVLNVGNLQNRGLDLFGTFKQSIGDWNFSINANLSFVRNKVLSLENNDVFISSTRVLTASQPISYTSVGQPIGYFYGYKVDGIFQTQEQLDNTPKISSKTGLGDLIYRDINGDGKITEADKTIIGNPWPKATYGFGLYANYKWFDLTIAFSGVYKRDLFNSTRQTTHSLFSDYSTTTRALDRWTPTNHSTSVFRMDAADPNGNSANPSSWYIEDGSFLRLKNLQVGVTLPKSLAKKFGMELFRVYGSAQNLLTFTKYQGLDPEFAIGNTSSTGVDSYNYPQPRTFIIGLQVTL
jgi:TonB-dependent starch-binding outer membrane protein SusC